jgi:hypothetical protein
MFRKVCSVGKQNYYYLCSVFTFWELSCRTNMLVLTIYNRKDKCNAFKRLREKQLSYHVLALPQSWPPLYSPRVHQSRPTSTWPVSSTETSPRTSSPKMESPSSASTASPKNLRRFSSTTSPERSPIERSWTSRSIGTTASQPPTHPSHSLIPPAEMSSTSTLPSSKKQSQTTRLSILQPPSLDSASA